VFGAQLPHFAQLTHVEYRPQTSRIQVGGGGDYRIGLSQGHLAVTAVNVVVGIAAAPARR